MSEELEQQVNELKASLVEVKAENERLKKQLADNGVGVNALLAQLDAHKQQLQQDNQISLNIRTNCILLGKSNKELADANEVLKKRVCELEAKA